jgi:hypothetical protein
MENITSTQRTTKRGLVPVLSLWMIKIHEKCNYSDGSHSDEVIKVNFLFI